MTYFVGIDWASAEHAVCVVDQSGAVQDRFTVVHSATGISELISRLGRLGEAQSLPVALERPSGLLVDCLVEAAFPVVPIHPNVVKASRPRYGAALAKSDPGDAFILADILRTDGHRFRRLAAPSDATRALRALVRSRDDLVAERVRLGNQLRALLESFWPGPLEMFFEIDSAIALAFLRRYPTPQSASHLGEKRLAAFLVTRGYSGQRSAAELLERLRAAPVGRVTQAEAEAKKTLVVALAAILEPLVEQITVITKAVTQALLQHPDGVVVASFPRAGRINAAQILAELGDDKARFASDDQLAGEGGVAPVTRASGKHHGVAFRAACNKRLRRALTCFADNSRRGSTWAADVYRRARTRGCDHPHAVRILARAWVRVLWRCWQRGVPYDVSHHRAALALATP